MSKLPEFDRVYWRGLLGFTVVPGLLQLLLLRFCFRYDPPQWLVSREQIAEAREVLLRIHRGDQSVVEAEIRCWGGLAVETEHAWAPPRPCAGGLS